MTQELQGLRFLIRTFGCQMNVYDSERLAGLLLELGDRFGKKDDDHVRVGLTLKREEVAEMAGITVETAIRLLSVFRDEELLTIDGRTITLLNPDRLARIARR